MTSVRSQLGSIGEQIAIRHLEDLGMVILDRNWRCTRPDVRGELDIIARDGAVLVVCEVKARRSASPDGPLESITPRKVSQLRRLAAAWLAEAGLGPRHVRLDAVGVSWPVPGGDPRVDHIRAI